MDYPSPLIALYPPPTAFREQFFRDENNTLHILSFMNALYHYFRIEETVLKAKPDTNGAFLASLVEEFRTKFKDAFVRIPCTVTDGSITISQFPEEVRAFMLQAGRECCFKLLNPFSSSSKPKDSDFVLAAVSGFSRVFNRLAPLWSLSDVLVLIPAMSVVMSRLMQCWDTDRAMCRFLSGLMMEISAIDCYRTEFMPLLPAQRADVRHPIVRRAFWNASFLFSHLDPKWDRHGSDPAWIRRAIDDYLGLVADGADLRARLFQDASVCMQRVLKREDDIRRLQAAKSRFHPEDQPLFDVAVQNLRECDASMLHPSHALLSSLTGGDNLLNIMADDIFHFDVTTVVPSSAAPAVTALAVPSPCSRAPAVSESTVKKSVEIARHLDSLMAANDGLAAAGQLSDKLHMELVLEEEEDAGVQESSSPAKKKKKRPAQNQRRKLAKERQMQELSAILGEMCHTVAVDAAQQNMRVAPMVQADVLDELVLAMVAEVAAEMRYEIESIPLKAVMAKAKAKTLPVEFARELVGVLLPGLENVLANSIECFICYSTLDFSRHPLGIRYLTCCAGGAFACPGCIAVHTKRHPLVAEERIVNQAVSIRRQLKIGEFGGV